MKKIDAHSHIGSFGGWAGVAFTAEKLLEQMDEYEIEKTFLTGASFQDNDTGAKAFLKYPDKIVCMGQSPAGQYTGEAAPLCVRRGLYGH